MILGIALVLFLVTRSTHTSEKEKIIEYYIKMTNFNKSEQYRTNSFNYTEFNKDYSKIANDCGFYNDDIIPKIVDLNYDNDSDVLRVRDEWYNIKSKIDSTTIKNRSK
jgi:hypothetical protein